MKLNFKKWVESIFGGLPQEEMPSSEIPRKVNNNAFINPDLLNPLPGNKKLMKKMKKQTKD